MEAKKYFEEKIRLWDSLRTEHKGVYRCVGVNCLDCPFNSKYGCLSLKIESVDIVEKWSKEHPKNTYLSVLKEKFPNIDTNNITRKLCPRDFYGNNHPKYPSLSCGDRTCKDCWNREYE